MGNRVMSDAERKTLEAWFHKLINSPAIQNSLIIRCKNPDPNDGDTRPEFNPKMPTLERIDSMIKALKS